MCHTLSQSHRRQYWLLRYALFVFCHSRMLDHCCCRGCRWVCKAIYAFAIAVLDSSADAEIKMVINWNLGRQFVPAV
jgi:hypothetical protein